MISAKDMLLADLPKEGRADVLAVAQFAKKHLSTVKRRSGESYAEHGVEVARVLKESKPTASLLGVALLHDLLVHPDGKELLAQSPLSARGRELVFQMHSLRRLHINENTEDLDTVMDAFMAQPELLPLRMAHRVNDVRRISRFSKSLQKEIAQEALHMYAAIAGRLGMMRWRVDIEDGSFPLLQPRIAASLQQQFAATKVADALCLKHTQEFLQQALESSGISVHVETRVKGLYSTYRKMVIKQRAFEDLTDRLAIRIIVNKVEDCYRALGVIHAVMNPIPGKLKDYIGAPKENGYKSIHTVVYPLPGVTDQPMELQIRTHQMHRDCEYGPASHADYKQAVQALGRNASRVNLFRNLQQLREEAKTPQQFEESLRMYFREDHIALFDAQNNIYHLKSPATAMDFVCNAFPQKCTKMKAVKINGRQQLLGTTLHDGDTVEVQFGRGSHAKKAWIQACLHTSSKKLLQQTMKGNGADDGIRTRDLRLGKATL